MIFKCCISKYSFHQVGYCFVDDSIIVQFSPSLYTTTSEIVAMTKEEVYMFVGFEMDAGGQIIPDKGKYNYYLLEFGW